METFLSKIMSGSVRRNWLMTAMFVMGLMAVALTFLANAAVAAPHPHPCYPREVMLQIIERLSEHQISRGVISEKWVVEVFSSKDGKDWSIFFSHTNGAACVMVTGGAWETIKSPEDVAAPGSKTAKP